ncbi:MAG: hypothetical protein QXT31_07490 [Candidatus Bathyarchaeia archaeon]
MNDNSLKLLLILEGLFSGAYMALTRGLLFVYLVSIGLSIEGISIVIGISGLSTAIINFLLYKHPKFLTNKVWLKFIIFHGLERILFLFIPLTKNYLLISIIFAAINSFPIGTFINLIIYGSFSEVEIKEITAKRTASFNVSSMIGFTIAMIFVAFMPLNVKFIYSYFIGSMIGLLSTFIVAFMRISHLEGKISFPKIVEQPKLFSTSLYFIIMLTSGNLLAMVWVPYVMNYLGGQDYLVVAMNLAGMLASVIASLFWKNLSLETLRNGISLDITASILALAIPYPTIHPIISAISSFTYTGSNFLGNFLFARYNRWLGAIKSSVLLSIVLGLAQAIIAPITILLKGDYFFIILTVIALKLIAFLSKSTPHTSQFLFFNSEMKYPGPQPRSKTKLFFNDPLIFSNSLITFKKKGLGFCSCFFRFAIS